MLIVPVSRQPDWRHPPVITLLLILLNCLIYFGVQSGDDRRQDEALRYYASAGLETVELPRYVKHLETTARAADARKAAAALDDERWPEVLMAMERDQPFMQQLRDGKVIQSEEENFGQWRRQRTEFDRLNRPGLVERFGFRPADPSVSALFGHMFLHGSFDHLLGNMAILFIVGYLVEETLGKGRYLTYYLAAGIGAGLFDFVFNASRMMPGIGASGAISGVMAMFVALYGLRKIRFFYWILVYFDFFRAPAIVILPLWMANELYQYLFNHGSPVNYMAHLGGFATGTALIAAQRLLGKRKFVAPEQEAPVDSLPAELAKVDKLLGELRIEQATQALRQLAEARPRELLVVGRYYKVARNAPASEDYHRAAALVFALPDDHPGVAELIHETYVEYLKLAKPTVRFTVRQLITLIRRLGRADHADDADRLTQVLARRAPQDAHLPDLLLLVSEAYRRVGKPDKRDAMLQRLQIEYPGSEAANAAIRLTR